ncbi:MAG: radical SAM protein [Desulfatibacillum sp.]|nr:radical SAM protein [Desulfatibacillum sp.]
MNHGKDSSRNLPRVLLLNPPAAKPVLRDYYCSTRPKTSYYWQPVDLLCLAAQLDKRARVLMVDAVTHGIPPKTLRKMVKAFAPHAIYCMVSTLTEQEDLALLKQLAGEKARIVIGGEAALNPNFFFEEYPVIDALALDFTAPELGDFLLEGRVSGRLRTRDQAPGPPPNGTEYSMGVTPHNTVDNALYKIPLWRGVFHSLLTDFGCPHRCSFCNSGLHSLGHKTRKVKEIGQELELLKRLEAKQIYLRDMTFGANKSHGHEVLDLLAGYPFTLRGYLRADQITPNFSKSLKRAGFAMAQIGVESPLPEARKAMGKNLGDEVFIKAFRQLHEQGIEAGAHFMVGFDQDHPLIARYCVDMAAKLGAAYCSINIYEHRLGARPILPADRVRRHWFSLHARAMMARYNAPRQARFLLTHLKKQAK